MPAINIHTPLKLVFTLIILGSLIFGFVCLDASTHSSMHAPSELMSTVNLMIISSQWECCSNSILNHIETWKSVLSAPSPGTRAGILLLILGLAMAFMVSGWRCQTDFIDRHLLSDKFYARDNPDQLSFSHLKLAYARGILNPKIY